jgi:hypothetical protein
MHDIEKAQSLSGIMLVCACMFGVGTFGLASAIHRQGVDEVLEGAVKFETLQDCEQQTDLEAAAHFDQEARSVMVDSFCAQNKAAGSIEDVPVSAAGIMAP